MAKTLFLTWLGLTSGMILIKVVQSVFHFKFNIETFQVIYFQGVALLLAWYTLGERFTFIPK